MITISKVTELLTESRATLLSDANKSLGLCNEALQFALVGNDMEGEAEARHLHAQILFKLGKNVEAIEEIKKAIALREQTGNMAKTSASLNNLGIFLTEIADYPAAMEACFRSLRIKEELDDTKGIAATLVNIGSIYHRLGNSQEELKIYERSLQIAESLNDSRMIAYNHLNLGLAYSALSQYEAALKFLTGLESTFLSFDDKHSAVKAMNNLGLILLQTGRLNEAHERFAACLALARDTGNATGMSSSLTNMAEVEMLLQKTEAAKKHLDEAVQIARENSLKTYLQDARQILTKYYYNTGDYKQAYEEFRQYSELKDELLNIQNLKQLGELKLKYDLDKKEKESLIDRLKNVELKEALDKLKEEKGRSDKLLLNILPEEVADELKATGTAKAKYFDMVTVMFIDIKNFTIISQQLSPEALVAEIDLLFSGFDEIISRLDIEKIKTIGDAYMCAGGIPAPDSASAEKVALAALEINEFVQRIKAEREQQKKIYFEIRTGINSGPVVAGIVGSSKFAYDIWGDTVNTAARMEQSGETGKINISGETYELLRDKFNCTHRGKINAKNKGEVDMYFLLKK